MQKYVLCLLILICLHQEQLMAYGLYSRHEGNTPITRLALYSERCSGSNYIQSLVLTNMEGISLDESCHKHFPPWLELHASNYLGSPSHYTFEGSDDLLVVVIFRNPYDWVRSLHRKPWHAALCLQNIPFSQFIRQAWQLNLNQPGIVRLQKQHPFMDLNPVDGTPFTNALMLRTAKIRTMLKIKERAKNVYYINYETVRDYPQEVLQELQEVFDLHMKSEYQPVLYYKGMERCGIYQETDYEPISPEDLIHINSYLDEKLESEIGYSFN